MSMLDDYAAPIKADLTQEERDSLPKRWALVWAAVYGTEWARAHLLTERASTYGFEHHEAFDHSERAATMADRAVYQGRKFEKENG